MYKKLLFATPVHDFYSNLQSEKILVLGSDDRKCDFPSSHSMNMIPLSKPSIPATDQLFNRTPAPAEELGEEELLVAEGVLLVVEAVI